MPDILGGGINIAIVGQPTLVVVAQAGVHLEVVLLRCVEFAELNLDAALVDGDVGVPVATRAQEQASADVEQIDLAGSGLRAGVDVLQAQAVDLAGSTQVEESLVDGELVLGVDGNVLSRGGGQIFALSQSDGLAENLDVDRPGVVEGRAQGSHGVRDDVGISSGQNLLGGGNGSGQILGQCLGGVARVVCLSLVDECLQSFDQGAHVDVVAEIGQMEVVEDGPVCFGLGGLAHADLELAGGDDDLNLLVDVAIVHEAAVGARLLVGIPQAAFLSLVTYHSRGSLSLVEDGHQRMLDLVGIIVGADGLGAVIAAGVDFVEVAVAIESLEVEAIGAVGHAERDVEVEGVGVPALLTHAAAGVVIAFIAGATVVAAVECLSPQVVACVIVG